MIFFFSVEVEVEVKVEGDGWASQATGCDEGKYKARSAGASGFDKGKLLLWGVGSL